MSVWLPSAPCTPGACLEPARPAAAGRAVLRLAAVFALVLAGVALSPPGGRLPAGPVRWWCRCVVRAAGVRVRVTGAAPPTGGLLPVANHISWVDIPLPAAVRPARTLAKAEIRRWPVVGRPAARGALFIERDRLRALPGTVARIADALRDGRAVAVFPEGSTWCGRAQGPFRRAAFQAALDARVPVQPVRLRYRSATGTAGMAPAFVDDDALAASVWRVVSTRGLVADVEIRAVIPRAATPTGAAWPVPHSRTRRPHRTRPTAGGRRPPPGRRTEQPRGGKILTAREWRKSGGEKGTRLRGRFFRPVIFRGTDSFRARLGVSCSRGCHSCHFSGR